MKSLVIRKCAVLGILSVLLLTVLSVVASAMRPVAFAADGETVAATVSGMDTTTVKAIIAGIVITVVALGTAIMMGLSILKAIDGIVRQPEAEGKIRTTMMLGLVFIETAIIYALIVAILIVFVL